LLLFSVGDTNLQFSLKILKEFEINTLTSPDIIVKKYQIISF